MAGNEERRTKVPSHFLDAEAEHSRLPIHDRLHKSTAFPQSNQLWWRVEAKREA